MNGFALVSLTPKFGLSLPLWSCEITLGTSSNKMYCTTDVHVLYYWGPMTCQLVISLDRFSKYWVTPEFSELLDTAVLNVRIQQWEAMFEMHHNSCNSMGILQRKYLFLKTNLLGVRSEKDPICERSFCLLYPISELSHTLTLDRD